LAGPPPPGWNERCNDKRTCPAGQVCIDEVCHSQCASSYACAANEACIGQVCEAYSATCSGDGDCAEGFYCGDSGACSKRLALGAACGSNPQACRSGLCVDGACCDSPCDGLCQSCRESATGLV